MSEATAAAAGNSHLILFFHSVLRWGLIMLVAIAGFSALAGWLGGGALLNWQRNAAIWAVVLCYTQLGLGLLLYGMDIKAGVFDLMPEDGSRYWRLGHPLAMLLVVALVTSGRLASKNARTERGKQQRVAVLYLAALALLLLLTPWWFTAMGDGRGWI